MHFISNLSLLNLLDIIKQKDHMALQLLQLSYYLHYDNPFSNYFQINFLWPLESTKVRKFPKVFGSNEYLNLKLAFFSLT